MMPNIFETLSEGRFLDLGSRLTAEEIETLGANPFRTCPECHGEGVIGMLVGMTDFGLAMMPLPCPVCEGEGEVAYITDN
jgi:DnaJ-class molecular chaperone